MELDRRRVDEIIKAALKEDVGPIDVTTSSTIQRGLNIKADIITRDDGIACGLQICETVFDQLDKDLKFKPQVKDGDPIYREKVLCYLEGPARAILTGERTALNFLGRLSGIATAANRFVKICEPYGVKIMDTRKTTPLLRHLEKYAVKTGGGYNHRMGLWDQVLIKDNHLKAIRSMQQRQGKPIPIDRMLKDLRGKTQKNTKIEIEIGSLKEFEEALKGKPDIIMLDNMTPEDVKRAVAMRKKAGALPFIEVSGNVNLENIAEYAKARPDMISIGSITHSFRSLDLSMEVYG
jgi:nicotinate-nucleotide pyrophosphorylase (carboxylating)